MKTGPLPLPPIGSETARSSLPVDGPRHQLVVLYDEYIDKILDGRKQIECRLSSVRRAPYEIVRTGDILWFKPPSRPVRAIARAGACRFVKLDRPQDVGGIASTYSELIAAPAEFFASAASWARYVSLIWIDWVMAISPLAVAKRDPRSWVVLDGPPLPGRFIGPVESSQRGEPAQPRSQPR